MANKMKLSILCLWMFQFRIDAIKKKLDEALAFIVHRQLLVNIVYHISRAHKHIDYERNLKTYKEH